MDKSWLLSQFTAWKVSKYGVFSSPCFPVFGLNTEIYGVNVRSKSPHSVRIQENMNQEKTQCLETFHAAIPFYRENIIRSSIQYVFGITYKVVIFRSSPPEVFLRKGVLKIRSKFTGEHPCRNVVSVRLHATLLKSRFGIGVLL